MPGPQPRFAASTTNVRVVRIELAEGVKGPIYRRGRQPGAIESFEIALAARVFIVASQGDRQNVPALKVTEFPRVTFRLIRFDGGQPECCTQSAYQDRGHLKQSHAQSEDRTARHRITVKGAVSC